MAWCGFYSVKNKRIFLLLQKTQTLTHYIKVHDLAKNLFPCGLVFKENTAFDRLAGKLIGVLYIGFHYSSHTKLDILKQM